MDSKQLLLLIARENTDRQISSLLGYSVKTVNKYISNLIQENNSCRGRLGLVLSALKSGLITIDEIAENGVEKS